MANAVITIMIILFILLVIGSMTGMTWLFLILGIILAIVLIMRNRDLKKNIYKMPPDELHITNVDKGGVFRLNGVEGQGTLTLKVIAKHLYQEGDFYWYELECDKGEGEKVWIDVEDDDETIVTLTLKKMTLSQLGVTQFQLDKIDDEEEGSIRYNGINYHYKESDNAVFYRYCDDKNPEKLYYWDFENGNYTVSVEKWGENEYQAFFCQKMLPNQVEVLSNNGEGV